MSKSVHEILLREIRLLLLPLAVRTTSDLKGGLLFTVTGWDFEAGSDPATDHRFVELIDAYMRIDDLIESPPESLTDVLEALDSVKQLFTAVRQVPAQPATELEGLEELAEELTKALVIGYLKSWHPAVHDLLALLTIIRTPADILLKRIPDLLTDPLEILRTEYLNPQGLVTAEDAKAVADKLFPRLAALFVELGFHAVYGLKSENGSDLGDLGNHLGAGILTVFLQPDFEVENRYGVKLGLSPRDLGDLGLVVIPFGEISPFWDVDIDLTAAAAGFAIGPQGLTTFGASDPTGISIGASVFNLAGSAVGGTTGTRLEIGQFQISGDLNLKTSDQNYGLLLDMGSSALVISADDGDGFLKTILPQEGIRVDFDLAIGWSKRKGFYFRGGAGLETVLPVHASAFGVLTFDSIYLAIKTDGFDIRTAVAASLGTQIGPVHALVDQVGFEATIAFPEDGGNLGIFDLDIHFKPPNGIGLVIDAQAVTGAGFLDFYPDRGEYLGAAQLRIKDKINVKAIGIILTKPTLSFLLLVSAEFPPVQLGLGFKLNGVGGLAGIHRGINEERLFAGLRDNTLDDLLFPEDPLKDIHGLIGKLNGVFPPAEGRYTFGLMGLITWGPQDLVTIELGLIVEFPTSLRLAVVGTLKAAVTKTIQGRDVSILHLQVNFAGLIDFDEQFIRFDAALYQSKLLGLALEGEMALRIKYGSNSDLVMTLGGFHPDFQPPALRLPADLRRLQITLRSGNPQIWIDAYLAVTANTFQFGAGGHLRFSKWGVRVSGDLGFDALFQFSPFRFEAGAYFHLTASWKGHEFAAIEIDGVFSGPSPWRIRGQFKLKICWFLKISVPFDESWGDADPTLLGLIDVLPLLVEDLRAPGNWERTPGRTRLLVTARQSLHMNQHTADLWLHPNDLLTVRQNTVPLGLHIDKFSEKRPQGASRFTVALQATDGTTLSGTPVKNHFAPGQFFNRSDEEKLSSKSYELFEAGVDFEGMDTVAFNAWLGQDVAYESAYVDDPAFTPPQPAPPKAESLQDFQIAVLNNTLANSMIARRAKPKTPITPDQITEQYVVADQSTLATHENMVTDSETEARLLLRELVRNDPRKERELTVLLRSEAL